MPATTPAATTAATTTAAAATTTAALAGKVDWHETHVGRMRIERKHKADRVWYRAAAAKAAAEAAAAKAAAEAAKAAKAALAIATAPAATAPAATAPAASAASASEMTGASKSTKGKGPCKTTKNKTAGKRTAKNNNRYKSMMSEHITKYGTPTPCGGNCEPSPSMSGLTWWKLMGFNSSCRCCAAHAVQHQVNYFAELTPVAESLGLCVTNVTSVNELRTLIADEREARRVLASASRT
jgi:hypothetical protein